MSTGCRVGCTPASSHDLGLVAALRSELASFEREHGIQVALRAWGVLSGLPEDVALCLYRVAQEALTNIRKHSAPTASNWI